MPYLLLIDNQEFEHALFQEVLEDLNIQLVSARNGQQALQLINNIPALCLIFLNPKLPNVHHEELFESIKTIRPNIPVIAYSAVAEEDFIKQCYKTGYHEVILKPVDLSLITNTIIRYTSLNCKTIMI